MSKNVACMCTLMWDYFPRCRGGVGATKVGTADTNGNIQSATAARKQQYTPKRRVSNGDLVTGRRRPSIPSLMAPRDASCRPPPFPPRRHRTQRCAPGLPGRSSMHRAQTSSPQEGASHLYSHWFCASHSADWWRCMKGAPVGWLGRTARRESARAASPSAPG